MESSSAPIPGEPVSREILKEQKSAPSYFVSLENNEAPPFKKPGIEIKPILLAWTFMDKDATNEIIKLASYGNNVLRVALEQQIVRKMFVESYNISEKQFLSSLLSEAYRYGELLNFNPLKMSTLLTIYVNSHKYFKSYYWLSPKAVWAYFKELMVRHTVDDSPDGEEVFEPPECYDVMSHFHAIYLCNLPLIHIRVFGAHQLKFCWPF